MSWLTGAAAAEKVTYYHFDALGSPAAATDEQGNVIWRETYQPYGERIKKEPAAAANPRWYTGHPEDAETGLLYMGARYYDPVLGRFYAVDRVAFTEKNPQSFNRYAYGNNNPYRYIDPDGNVPIDYVTDLPFVVYDFGQFLGAGLAYGVGAFTGDQALMAEARAGLAETGATLGGSLAGWAIPYAPAAVTRGVARGAYETALAGGRHAGLLKLYTDKPVTEVQRALRSYERNVLEHKQKLANPSKFAERWGEMSELERQGLLSKWQKDVQRNQELTDIMRGILRERGL